MRQFQIFFLKNSVSDETGLALGSKSGAEPSWCLRRRPMCRLGVAVPPPRVGVFGYLCPVSITEAG